MDVIGWFKEKFGPKNETVEQETTDMSDELLAQWLGLTTASSQILSEITYFTCLKMLSETLAKLPVKFYQRTDDGPKSIESNKAHELLNIRPNPNMSPTTFWSTVETNRNHHGNGFVWIQRKLELKKYGGSYEVEALWPMPSDRVSILIDDAGVFGKKGKIYYRYQDKFSSDTYVFRQEDVLHFKTWLSFDGLSGESVRSILKHTLTGALESQTFMNNLYEQGMTASMALQYTGDLDTTRVKKLREKYEELLAGAKNAGRIVPVPVGLQLQPLNVKLTDSQFFELKKYSSLQIASAFGIKPNQINDYEKSSYANSESQQLSFLVDTELFILKHYEEEICYKLLGPQEVKEQKYYKFNEKVILRADSKTQAEMLQMYVQGSIYKPNEARAYLDKANDPHGNELLANGNMIPLKDVGKQYEEGGI